MNTVLMSAQGSLRPVPCRPDHSVSTHLTCPDGAFARYPSASVGSRRLPDEISSVDADSSLTSGRIEFVILRTGRSPSIAPHLASRRRSYRGVRAGERLPGEDFHLSVMAPLQAHVASPANGRRVASGERRNSKHPVCVARCFELCRSLDAARASRGATGPPCVSHSMQLRVFYVACRCQAPLKMRVGACGPRVLCAVQGVARSSRHPGSVHTPVLSLLTRVRR